MTPNLFMGAKFSISENDKLRIPQKHGYMELYRHFVLEESSEDALVVLPTGVGKSGLMALAPYGISKGRVLVIAPQLTIKDSLVKTMDSSLADNFWIKHDVVEKTSDLPVLVEYNKNLTVDILHDADIVVINIQKLQEASANSPLHFLSKDFFDMIIIDEAHHSTARSWTRTTHHFSEAKVIKVTATPLRTDKQEVSGKLVYRYKLSQAMAEGYVKSLQNNQYIPEELKLTIDKDDSRLYTIDEILDLGLKDEEWVSRSVAYSEECANKVISQSIEMLEEKRSNTTVPHKIIAVASNIEQAERIASIYSRKDLRATVLHSKLEDNIIEQRHSDIENHRVDVVVNVSMLGEGYDHKYLTIGAIFRAYRNLLPYAQFVGRVLRSIPEDEVKKASDNIASIVSHRDLKLDPLWDTYKIELNESEIIKHLSDIDIELPRTLPPGGEGEGNELETGSVLENGDGSLSVEDYLDTPTLQRYREELEEKEKKISELMKLMDIDRAKAEQAYDVMNVDENRLLRPDIIYTTSKAKLDRDIREIMIPEILVEYNLALDGQELLSTRLVSGRFSWISKAAKNNGAALGMFINTYLKQKIGVGRDDWEIQDVERGLSLLADLRYYIEKVLKEYFQN